MSADNCIFCGIVEGRIPAKKVFEDDQCLAFEDLDPQAPKHILIVPKNHIDSLDKALASDVKTLGHLLIAAAEVARALDIAESGYRVVVNTNSDGGQTVFHLHVHLLGGRAFVFPPG